MSKNVGGGNRDKGSSLTLFSREHAHARHQTLAVRSVWRVESKVTPGTGTRDGDGVLQRCRAASER